jgi:Mn-dependent DtxR family transcriptional regulator
MTTLRASQVETLDWLRLHAGTDGAHPGTVARALGLSLWGAIEEADRLRKLGHVEFATPDYRIRLTNKGRSELSGAEQTNERKR